MPLRHAPAFAVAGWGKPEGEAGTVARRAAASSAASRRREQRRLRENLQREVDGAALYDAMADAEPDPNLAAVYRQLAGTERAHARIWRRKLADPDGALPPPTFKTRMLVWLARRFGAAAVLPIAVADERRDRGAYAGQADALAARLPQAEASHGQVLQAALARGQGMAGASLARLEGRHLAGGNALRAAVLGANDGLVSNLSLVMGMAGAAEGSRVVLLTGIAGLVAGACSMAMGEWLSVNSSREFYARQIRIEADELEQSPEEEGEELALIYRAKGLGADEAQALAKRMLGQKDKALDTLAREELGLDPDELGGSAWGAAGTSFVLFALGAIFPVLPYALFSGLPALAGSLLFSAAALAVIGAGTSFFTGRGLAFSAARQMAIGLAAAAITYGLGRLAGATLG